jgi:protein ImuA
MSAVALSSVASSAGEPQDTPDTTLSALRRAVADISAAPRGEMRGETRLALGLAPLDRALDGGLDRGALHEIGPATPHDGGAATGFAVALAVLALRRGGQTIWIRPDFAAAEAGELYGPGLALMGLPLARLVILKVPRPRDALWAMEEALQCRAAGAIVTELTGDDADLTATRRLALAAGAGGGLGLLLRHQPHREPNAAMTRWEVASSSGERDGFGGLSRPTFVVSLVKNRHGPTGQWRLSWDHHERVFVPALTALSRPVAATALDRSPHPQRLARTG